MPDVNGAWDWCLEQWKTKKKDAIIDRVLMRDRFGLTDHTSHVVLRLTQDQAEGDLFTNIGMLYNYD